MSSAPILPLPLVVVVSEPAQPARGQLARLPSHDQLRAKVAPATKLPSLPTLADSLPARPSTSLVGTSPAAGAPADGTAPTLQSLLARHVPSPQDSSTAARPQTSRRSTRVPSLDSIRERVGEAAAGAGAKQLAVQTTTARVREENGGSVKAATKAAEGVHDSLALKAGGQGAGRGEGSVAAADTEQRFKDQDLPLGHVWSLTYTPPMPSHAPSSLDVYSSSLVTLGDLRTVQDWARHVNNLPSPSMLPKGANYGLFRSGIQPVFEDRSNATGGRWVLTLRNLGPETSGAAIDACWAEVMMALVGGELPTDEVVSCTGAVVGVRQRGDRLQLWTTTKTPVERIVRVGERLFTLVQPTLTAVEVAGGGYQLEFQANFPTPGVAPKYRSWSSGSAPPTRPPGLVPWVGSHSLSSSHLPRAEGGPPGVGLAGARRSVSFTAGAAPPGLRRLA